MRFEWETIKDLPTSNTYRAKVYGGWLVNNVTKYRDERGKPAGQSESMVFVPDPSHKWEIESE